jgi:hypothetical protein
MNRSLTITAAASTSSTTTPAQTVAAGPAPGGGPRAAAAPPPPHDRGIRHRLADHVAVGVAGQDQARGVGDRDHGARGQLGSRGDLDHRVEVDLGEDHRPHRARAVDGGIGQRQHRLARRLVEAVVAQREVARPDRLPEVRLVGRVAVARARLRGAEDLPVGADGAHVAVERESPLDVGEQRAARARVVHLDLGELGEADQQRARALDDPLVLRRGQAGEAERVLLRGGGRLPALLPRRREDQDQRGEHGEEDEQQQAEPQARQAKTPSHRAIDRGATLVHSPSTLLDAPRPRASSRGPISCSGLGARAKHRQGGSSSGRGVPE